MTTWSPNTDIIVTKEQIQLKEKKQLINYNADKRWQLETGGCLWNGIPVHSDRESQNKIIAERLAIAEDTRIDGDIWKFKDGIFRSITNADFIDISNTVRDHVKNSFIKEETVLAKIEAGIITTTTQIDDEY